jgi:large subunit ribosomal protein L31
MKAGIHPKYYDNCRVTCACGNTFTVGSTLPEIKVEICSKCHPFFTGEMKYVDTLGRVERFKQKQTKAIGKTYLKKKQRKLLKKAEAEKKEAERPKTLKEMLSRKS